MSTNKMFYVLTVLALAAVIFFTFREAASTAAIARADRSYDQVEQDRLNRLYAQVRAEDSYGEIETLRLDRSSGLQSLQDDRYNQVEALRSARGVPIADRSYDAIERLRAARGVH